MKILLYVIVAQLLWIIYGINCLSNHTAEMTNILRALHWNKNKP